MIFASRRVRVITVAVVMGASFLNGCTSWHPINAPVPDALARHPDVMFQVRLADGRKIDLWDAHIAGDSLMGTQRHQLRARAATPDERARGYSESVVKVPIGDVESLAVPRLNAFRTAVGVVAAVGAAFVIVAIIAFSTADSWIAGTY